MSQTHYDRLVRGVIEFQKIAREQSPFIGKLLDSQLEQLREDLKQTSYDKNIKQSLKSIQLEESIRDFIHDHRPQLVNLASQFNPHLDRGLLIEFIQDPLFFKVLKEEKDLYFNFEAMFTKNLNKFKVLTEPYCHQAPLRPEHLHRLSYVHYHQTADGTPTGGHRPKRLLPTKNIFQKHQDENYYLYKRRPFIYVKLTPYKLVGVFDIWSSTLYIHPSQSGHFTSTWEKYVYPRKKSWPIHESAVAEAFRRSLENNLALPLPNIGEETNSGPSKPVPQSEQRRTNAVDAIRKKYTEMTRRSYFDPMRHRVDILVPVTADGQYCNLNSEHTKRLMMFEIRSDVPDEDKAAKRRLFRDILPYALVSNPGEAIPLRDFIRFVPTGSVVQWMAIHIQPVRRK